jgi:hypothetical protein
MKWILLLTSMTLMSTQAMSQSTSVSSIYQNLKQSPLSFSADLTTQSYRNGGDATEGYKNILDTNTSYKITPVDKINMRTSMMDINGEDEGRTRNRLQSIQLHYKRSKLLTQDKNGIDLALQGRYSRDTNVFYKERYGSDGNFQFRTTVGRDFTNNFSVEAEGKFYQYISNDSKGKRSYDRSYKLEVIPTYVFNDSFRFIMENQIAIHNTRDVGTKGDITLKPIARYSFNRNVSLSVGVEFKPWEKDDSQSYSYVDGFTKLQTYSTNIYVSVF